jgi:hypothetical protein
MDILGQGLHQSRIQVIITQETLFKVVNRHQGLVQAVGLFLFVILDGASVAYKESVRMREHTPQATTTLYCNVRTTVVNKEGVTRLSLGDHFAHGCQDILLRRCRLLAIIQQEDNIGLVEPVDLGNVPLHILDIVMAASEDALLVSDIVNATIKRELD